MIIFGQKLTIKKKTNFLYNILIYNNNASIYYKNHIKLPNNKNANF